MSIICLQYGQCGNQIGETLFSTLYEDIKSQKTLRGSYCARAINKWFTVNKSGKWEPRSVLVDTENKVINQHIKNTNFKFKYVVAKSFGGSANNWAFGYSTRSLLLKNEVLDCVRSEVEKCDYLTSILNVFSSSGGTGSGVGSYLIEQLRDEYPNKFIINAVVLPYIKGEIVTQSYNSLLTLSKLYCIADSTILFENERLHHICEYTLNHKNITFQNINSVIANQLAAVFQPLSGTTTSQLLGNLTAHPSFKLLQIRNEPQLNHEHLKYESVRQWKPLIEALSKQSRFDFHQQNKAEFHIKHKSVSSALITRGSEKCSESDLKPLKNKNNYVNWLPMSDSFRVYHEPQKFNNLERHLAVVSNSNNVCVSINSIVEDAWNMFTHGAYLHHYKIYDIDEQYFLNSFEVMENILNNYKNL